MAVQCPSCKRFMRRTEEEGVWYLCTTCESWERVPSYTAEDTGLDFEAIALAVASEGMPHEYDAGMWQRSIFLGTVFALTPSGKYYMPFACSNVTEEEANEDREWWNVVDEELEKRELYAEGGEGCPTDIHVGRVLTDEEVDALTDQERQEGSLPSW